MFENGYYFHCARASVPRSFLEQGAGLGLVQMPMTGLVLEHSTRGPILLDAPLGPEGPSNMGTVLGALSRLFGVSFRQEWAVGARIRQCGYEPTDVNDAVMTHMHVDHTGGMATLPNCQFHVDQREWDFASSITGGLQGLAVGYALADYEDLGDRIRDFEAPAIEEIVDTSDGSLDLELAADVFGDGSIRAVRLPGHTRGQAGYIFEVGDRRVFHVGDAVHSLRNLTRRAEFGAIARNFADDLDTARRTLELLRTVYDANPDWLFLCAHDPKLGEACADGPVTLDRLGSM